MRAALTLGWLLLLGGSLAGFVQYVTTGDYWRAFGLGLCVVLVLSLRETLTGGVDDA